MKTIRFATIVPLSLLVLLLSQACQTPARAAEPEQWTAREWYIKLPSKAYKDLPTLMAEHDVVGGATLGNIEFVCNRSSYYILLVTPFFKYGPTQTGRVAVDGTEQTTTFRDLHGTRGAPRLDWDADILYSDFPKTMLEKLVDGATLRVDLLDLSWEIELKAISARVRAFTTFCETGRRLPGGGFRD